MRLLLVLLAFAALCAPAGAATVTFTAPPPEPAGTEPEESCSRYAACPPPLTTFTAAAGERNLVTVATDPGGLVFRDTGAPLTAGSGCTARPDASVVCPGGILSIDLSDGDDQATLTGTTAQTLRGGAGNDVLAAGGSVDGGEGDDLITGSANPDTITGGPGADTVTALDGNDTILDGDSPEADRLDAGEGVDELSFPDRATPVRVDLGARPQVGAENTVAGFERATGGAGADELLSDPAVGKLTVTVLDGRAGDDRLELRSPQGGAIAGGAGNDTLVGSPTHDTLDASEGNDVLEGGGGDDVLNAGAGDDTVRGGEDDDAVLAGPGRDTVLGGAGADRVVGGTGRDTVDGEAGADRLAGDEDADVLRGGAGADRLTGGSGNDQLDGGAGNDRLFPQSGADRVAGGTGADVVSAADRRRDRVACGAGADRATLDRVDTRSSCERIRFRSVRRNR